MSAYFPLFVDLSQKEILVVGAGRIASRRIESLSPFTEKITVIAPEASPAVQEMARQGGVRLLLRSYIEGEIPSSTYLVLAATNCEKINESIYRECQEKGILVNVCSNRELCDFYFPGVVQKEDLVIGVTAGGTDHRLARQMTEQIRQLAKETDFNKTEK